MGATAVAPVLCPFWRFARLAVVVAIGLACGCSARQAPLAPKRRLAIATGDETGVYYLLGRALAHVYNAKVPDVAATALPTTGSGFNVRAIEEGRAEMAFTQADVAYLAVKQGTSDHPAPYRNVRAIAVLYINAVQIVALKDSPLRHVRDLESQRVGVGAPESGTALAARNILMTYGLEHHIVAEPLAFEDLASSMAQHSVDAGFFVSSYPIPAVSRLDTAAGIRLLPVDANSVNRIRRKYPFYRPITIPKGTYVGQDRDISTIGVANILVCARNLPDDLVYRLTRVLFESLATLAEAHPAASAINAEQASATPIRLHAGAARFYREQELFR